MPIKPEQVPQIKLNTGHTIPQLGFGTLMVQPDREHSDQNMMTTARIVRTALEAGYRHIDSAQAYGTERGVGKAIAEAIAEAGLDRDQLFVTSKLANANHAPDDVRRSFEQTVDRLGLDYLDLFLVHWPLPTVGDGDYVATWRAVAGLVEDGRLRSAGVSNFQPDHLERIIGETGVVPAVNQVEVHPYFVNRAAQDATRSHGIAVEAHSPLGHDREPLGDPTIVAIATALARTPGQVILRWHLQNGDIAIPKSSNPERISANLDVFGFELDGDQMAAIDALDRGPEGRVGPNPDTYQGV